MPLTPEQIAKIRQKEAETPDALKRNPLNNYTEGWFHVTLNVRGEAPVLGYVVGDIHAPAGSADAPRCELTELGKAVEAVWERNPSIYPEVENVAFQIMPEHLHILWHLKRGNRRHLGRIVWGFMAGCSHEYWDILGIPWRDMKYEKGARAPEWQDRDHTHSLRGPALFTRGYNDVEAITAEEVQIKIEYIRSNPERRLIKGSHPAIFHVHRDKRSAHWTPERIMQGLCADRYIAASRDKQVMAWQQLTTKGTRNDRGKVSATLKFLTQPVCRPVLDLVGNLELLNRPLYPLICHRADAALFEQQMAAVLRVAREQGAVIVTACVSPKERSIVKQLQQELLPVIEVMDNGFSEKYKPAGRAFYAVAEGRRLEVTPWEYEYHRREFKVSSNAPHETSSSPDATRETIAPGTTRETVAPGASQERTEVPNITREMCMVMNEVVRVIAQRPDDWWKK